jgi:hypothetical protein
MVKAICPVIKFAYILAIKKPLIAERLFYVAFEED